MKLRKKTIALLLFSAAFICSVGVSAFVLWQTDVLNLPSQNKPVTAPVEESLTLYPAPAADGRWGYINEQGEVILPQIYEEALPFYGKAAWVKQNGLWGAVDAAGTVLVTPEYAEIAVYEDGSNRFICASGSNVSAAPQNSSLYDVNGQKLFGLAGDLKEMSSGLMAFSRTRNGVTTWGYINAHGEIIIEPVYAAVGQVSGNYALVRDMEGQKLLLNIYAQTGVPVDGVDSLDAVGSRMVLLKDTASGLYGYQDVNGELVIDYAFTAAEPFRGGAALAATDGGTGLLSPDGVWMAEPVYADGQYLGHNVYALKLLDAPGYLLVDELGEPVVADTVYGWEEWRNGLLACHTAVATLFINAAGELQPGLELSISPGVFRLGKLYGVQDMNGLSWFDDAGHTVYSVGRDRALSADVRLLTVLENSDVNYLVYYPQAEAVDGSLNSTWRRLNQALADNALGEYYDSYTSGGELKFAVRGNCYLVTAGGVISAIQTLTLDDSWEAGGGLEEAVHTVCFDAVTGRQYRLADLFADGVNWRQELLEPARASYGLLAAAGAPEQPEMQEILSKRLSRNLDFSLSDEGLTLYFALSDGAVQLVPVSYQDIDSLLDKSGSLWQNLQGITREE